MPGNEHGHLKLIKSNSSCYSSKYHNNNNISLVLIMVWQKLCFSKEQENTHRHTLLKTFFLVKLKWNNKHHVMFFTLVKMLIRFQCYHVSDATSQSLPSSSPHYMPAFCKSISRRCYKIYNHSFDQGKKCLELDHLWDIRAVCVMFTLTDSDRKILCSLLSPGLFVRTVCC